MTAVYVVTAASGESYRIERVYLYANQALGSPRLTTVVRWWSRFRQRME